HLDNIAPSFFGGLCVCFGVDPPRVAKVPLGAKWWVALVTPGVRMATKEARSLLPSSLSQSDWTHQMGLTAALITAFATGDGDLAKQSLNDPYAEPRRKTQIPHFDAAKKAALKAGAFGASISGAGPTIFALCQNQETALVCADAMAE